MRLTNRATARRGWRSDLRWVHKAVCREPRAAAPLDVPGCPPTSAGRPPLPLPDEGLAVVGNQFGFAEGRVQDYKHSRDAVNHQHEPLHRLAPSSAYA